MGAELVLAYTIKANDSSSTVLNRLLGDIAKWRSRVSSLISAPFRVTGAVASAPFKALTGLGGLGLQANIELIKRLGDSISDLVDRGARLEVVRKSFESLSQSTGPGAERLGRQLQEAANGTISQARAMEIANRALSAGINTNDIRTALDFVSKKAVTTGVDAGGAIEKIFTGLARGSTLFLDDFGILVDGIDGVQREFDRIHGQNAFEQLGPAAQKAELIRAAMSDMRRQMGQIGVTGKETVFQVARIRTAFTDAMDKLAGAVARSQRFQQFMKDVASVTTSVVRALGGKDQDKALGELANNAKRLIGAVVVDIGRELARGVVEAAQYFGPIILDNIKAIGKFLLDTLIDAAKKFAATLMQQLGKLDLFKGVFNQQDIADILKNPSPAAPTIGKFNFRGHGPFEETTNVIGELGQKARRERLGKDRVEKLSEDAEKRVLPSTVPGLVRERTRNQMEQRILQRAIQRGDVRPEFMRQAQDDLSSGRLGVANVANLTPRERRELLVNRSQELMQARLGKLQESRTQLDEKLAPLQQAADRRRARLAGMNGVGAGALAAPGASGSGADLSQILLQRAMSGGQVLWSQISGTYRDFMSGKFASAGSSSGRAVPRIDAKKFGQNAQEIIGDPINDRINARMTELRSGADMRIRGVPLGRDSSFMERVGEWGGLGIMGLAHAAMLWGSAAGDSHLTAEPNLVPIINNSMQSETAKRLFEGMQRQQSGGRGNASLSGSAADLMGAAGELSQAAVATQKVATAFSKSSRELARVVADL